MPALSARRHEKTFPKCHDVSFLFSLCILGKTQALFREKAANWGAYRIPPETGLLIPSEKRDYRNVAETKKLVPQGTYLPWAISRNLSCAPERAHSSTF